MSDEQPQLPPGGVARPPPPPGGVVRTPETQTPEAPPPEAAGPEPPPGGVVRTRPRIVQDDRPTPPPGATVNRGTGLQGMVADGGTLFMPQRDVFAMDTRTGVASFPLAEEMRERMGQQLSMEYFSPARRREAAELAGVIYPGSPEEQEEYVARAEAYSFIGREYGLTPEQTELFAPDLIEAYLEDAPNRGQGFRGFINYIREGVTSTSIMNQMDRIGWELFNSNLFGMERPDLDRRLVFLEGTVPPADETAALSPRKWLRTAAEIVTSMAPSVMQGLRGAGLFGGAAALATGPAALAEPTPLGEVGAGSFIIGAAGAGFQTFLAADQVMAAMGRFYRDNRKGRLPVYTNELGEPISYESAVERAVAQGRPAPTPSSFEDVDNAVLALGTATVGSAVGALERWQVARVMRLLPDVPESFLTNRFIKLVAESAGRNQFVRLSRIVAGGVGTAARRAVPEALVEGVQNVAEEFGSIMVSAVQDRISEVQLDVPSTQEALETLRKSFADGFVNTFFGFGLLGGGRVFTNVAAVSAREFNARRGVPQFNIPEAGGISTGIMDILPATDVGAAAMAFAEQRLTEARAGRQPLNPINVTVGEQGQWIASERDSAMLGALQSLHRSGGIDIPLVPINLEIDELVNPAEQAQIMEAYRVNSEKMGVEREPGARAFHGTGAVFEQFETEQIGTGEGAQVFGHGIYFSSQRGVADHYRKTLAQDQGEQKVTIAGRDTEQMRHEIMQSTRMHMEDPLAFTLDRYAEQMLTSLEISARAGKTEEQIVGELNDLAEGQFVRRRDALRQELVGRADTGTGRIDADAGFEIVEQLNDLERQMRAVLDDFVADVEEGHVVVAEAQPGSLFEVELDNDAVWLDWDQRVSDEQMQRISQISDADFTGREPELTALVSEWKTPDDVPVGLFPLPGRPGFIVQGAHQVELLHQKPTDMTHTFNIVSKIGGRSVVENHSFDSLVRFLSEGVAVPRGEAAYRILAEQLGGQEAASTALREAGFDGIRYPVGTMSGGGEGNNFVVFDPDQTVRPVKRTTGDETLQLANAGRFVSGASDVEFSVVPSPQGGFDLIAQSPEGVIGSTNYSTLEDALRSVSGMWTEDGQIPQGDRTYRLADARVQSVEELQQEVGEINTSLGFANDLDAVTKHPGTLTTDDVVDWQTLVDAETSDPFSEANDYVMGQWVSMHGMEAHSDLSQLRQLPLGDLQPATAQQEGAFDEERVRQHMGVLQRNGRPNPIWAQEQPDGTLEITDGHDRWEAANRLGRNDIEVFVQPLVESDMIGEDGETVMVPLTVERARRDYDLTVIAGEGMGPQFEGLQAAPDPVVMEEQASGPFTDAEMTKERLQFLMTQMVSRGGFKGSGLQPTFWGVAWGAAKTGGISERGYREAMRVMNQKPDTYRQIFAMVENGGRPDMEQALASGAEEGISVSIGDLEFDFSTGELTLEQALRQANAMDAGIDPETQLEAARTEDNISTRPDVEKIDREAVEAGAEPISDVTLGEIAQMSRIVERANQQDIRARRRAAVQARELMKKLARNITRPVAGATDVFYVEAIENLQAGVDPSFRTSRSLEQVERARIFADDKRFAKDLPKALLARVNARPLNKWTLSELQELHDRVSKLRRLGRLKYRLDVVRRREESRQDAADALEVMGFSMGVPPRPPVGTQALRDQEPGKIRQFVREQRVQDLRPQRVFDKLDGAKGTFDGKMFALWHTETANRYDGQRRMEDQRTEPVERYMKRNRITNLQLGRIPRGAKELGYVDWSVDRIMTLYMQRGNPQGEAAIEHGLRVPTADRDALIALLSPQQKELADMMLDDYRNNRERLRSARISHENKDMAYVDRYSPLVRINDSANPRDMFDQEQATTGFWRGFLEERKDLDPSQQTEIKTGAFGMWLESIRSQERYIGMFDHSRRLNRLLANKDFQEAVRQTHGKEMLTVLSAYASRVANPAYAYQGSEGTLLSHFRRNIPMAALAGNIVTAGKQIPSVFFYLPEAGSTHLIGSMVASANPAVFQEMKTTAQALDYRMRERNISRDLDELRRGNPTLHRELQRKVGEVGMAMIYAMDSWATTVGWNATYNRHVNEGLSQTEAAQKARDATLRTQPASHILDVAERYNTNQEWTRLLLQFSNQLNQIYNISSYDIPRRLLNRDNPLGQRMLQATEGVAGITMSAFAMYVLSHKKLPDEPEEIMAMFGEQLISAIPLYGRMLINGFGGYDPVDVPLNDVFDGVSAAIQRPGSPQTYEQILNMLGLTAGVPSVALRRAYRYLQTGEPVELIGRPPRRHPVEEALRRVSGG